MPDTTIPGALGVTVGVLVCAAQAFHSGDYRISALAGVIGTVVNLICFFRRLAIQAKAEQLRSKRQN